MPRLLFPSACSQNSPSTFLISSRLTDLRFAIAAPIFCTSRGPRYLNTSAASSSPSDIIRIALLVMPSAAIAGHPFLDDVGHYLRITARNLFGLVHALLVAAQLRL